MTTEFIEQDVLDAAYNLVSDYPGGARSLAPRIDKSSTSLSHEVTKTGAAKLGLETAVRITDLSGDLRILRAWASHTGQLLVPMVVNEVEFSKGCLARLNGVAKEFSDVVLEVSNGMDDNQISDNELHRIVTEGSELIASVYALMMAARVKNKAGNARRGEFK